MPTYRRSDEELERDIRLANEERMYNMDIMAQKSQAELEQLKEKGRVQIERAKITHKAEKRAGVWMTLLTIVPKCVLIISMFWLILFNKEVPESWHEYLGR